MISLIRLTDSYLINYWSFVIESNINIKLY